MLLLPNSGNSAKMVLSKIQSWVEQIDPNRGEHEREDNNNTVKKDILRTPNRCRSFEKKYITQCFTHYITNFNVLYMFFHKSYMNNFIIIKN